MDGVDSSRRTGSRSLLPFAALAAIVFVTYLPSLRNGFVWDDTFILVENPAVRSLAHVAGYFTDATTSASIDAFGFYRPLQTLGFALEYQLWGLNAAGYHATNLALHIFVTLLLFAILCRLGGAAAGAFAAALFFGVHAGHAETVLWIKGQPDLLCAALMLAAFGCHATGRGKTSFALFVLALFAKESAVVFLPLVVAYDVLVARLPIRTTWLRYAVLLATTLLFMVLRSSALPPVEGPQAGALSWGAAVPLTVHVVGLYARLILYPHPLMVDYFGLRSAWTPAGVAAGVLVAVLYLAAFVVLERKGRRLAAFGLAWFALAIGVVLAKNFTGLLPTTQVIAERFLYIPAIGLALVVCDVVTAARAGRARTLALAVVALAALVLAGTTFSRSQEWRSAAKLYAADVEKQPFSERLLRNLASELVDANRFAEARDLLLRHREQLAPEEIATLGFATYALGDKDAGRELVLGVVTSDYAGARPYVCMGVICGNDGNHADAVMWLQKAVSKEGTAKVLATAYNNLGVAFSGFGDAQQAVLAHQKAAELYPLFIESWKNLGAIYWAQGKWPEVVATYERLAVLDPGNPEWRKWAEQARGKRDLKPGS